MRYGGQICGLKSKFEVLRAKFNADFGPQWLMRGRCTASNRASQAFQASNKASQASYLPSQTFYMPSQTSNTPTQA